MAKEGETRCVAAVVRRQKAVRMLVQGSSQRDIARELKMSEPRVSELVREPSVRVATLRALSDAHEAALGTLRSGAVAAAEALVDIVSYGEREADRIRAATAILDRVGLLPSSPDGPTKPLKDMSLDELLDYGERVRSMRGEFLQNNSDNEQ